MIVVTGIGRSGTSLIAKLYRELGLDPGGEWMPTIEAGLEDPAIVRANRAIAWDLGLGLPLDPELLTRPVARTGEGIEDRDLASPGGSPAPARLARRAGRLAPRAIRRQARTAWSHFAASARARARTSVWRRTRRPRAVDWRRLDPILERHGHLLRRLAEERTVAKDPRFCWTLGVWASSGAPIDHVVVCLRDIPAVTESRVRAGHLSDSDRAAENSLIYGIGLLFEALHANRLSHDVIRFPDFLEAPERVYRAMRVPTPVERERFDEVFATLVRPDLVHAGR